MKKGICACAKLMILLTLALAFIFSTQSCESGGDILFQNNSERDVTIFYSHVRSDRTTDTPTKQGVVPAHGSATFSIAFVEIGWVNRITAIDASGKLMLSHDYTMPDLDKIGWKIVIPP